MDLLVLVFVFGLSTSNDNHQTGVFDAIFAPPVFCALTSYISADVTAKLQSNNEPTLRDKVEEWLAKEGFPLEYFAADACATAGFKPMQGFHVDSDPDSSPREIDVLAVLREGLFKRIVNPVCVIECKYTKDKPWVVLTSDQSRSTPRVIHQTLGSAGAKLALWLQAGNMGLHTAQIFDTRPPSGHSGREIFAGNRDRVYSTLQSVVTTSTSLLHMLEQDIESNHSHLEVAMITLPVILIDGRLFEGKYDNAAHKLVVEEVQRSRVFWGGTRVPQHSVPIDIVTKEDFPAFMNERNDELNHISRILGRTIEFAGKCAEANDPRTLLAKCNPFGGTENAPKLFHTLFPAGNTHKF